MMPAATRPKGRRKMVTTGALTSKKLARIDAIAEVVYWRVYFASDNYGTMGGDPWDVLHLACSGKNGMTEEIVGGALDALVSVGLLERWCEAADRTTWVHVLGHDLHQQASWIKKRGPRTTPVPPSLRSHDGSYVTISDPMQADATFGSEPSPNQASDPPLGDARPPTTTSIAANKNGPDDDADFKARYLLLLERSIRQQEENDYLVGLTPAELIEQRRLEEIRNRPGPGIFEYAARAEAAAGSHATGRDLSQATAHPQRHAQDSAA